MQKSITDTPFFSKILRKEFVDKEPKLKLYTFATNDQVIVDSADSNGLFMVISGAAKSIVKIDGKEISVSNYTKGQLFGFTNISEGTNAQQLTVIATECCEVVFIPMQLFIEELKNDPSLWQRIMSMLAREMVSVKNKLKVSYGEN